MMNNIRLVVIRPGLFKYLFKNKPAAGSESPAFSPVDTLAGGIVRRHKKVFHNRVRYGTGCFHGARNLPNSGIPAGRFLTGIRVWPDPVCGVKTPQIEVI
jgi:hypothetical protein